jgi:hypothetical protein
MTIAEAGATEARMNAAELASSILERHRSDPGRAPPRRLRQGNSTQTSILLAAEPAPARAGAIEIAVSETDASSAHG